MAVDVREIYSRTEFKRDTNQFLKRLRRSGSPLVLTVKNGRGRSARAIADLDPAFEWITGRSPEAARRWYARVPKAR